MRLAPEVPFTIQSVPMAGGLAGTWDTIWHMRRLAREGSRDANIRAAAVRIIWLQGERNELHEVESIFDYVRDSIRYIRDPLCFEAVAHPAQVLALGYGDCDDKSTLLAALLESVGYATRFVIAGYRSNSPEHVYAQVLVNGQWIDADPTEPYSLGYAPPSPIFIEYERV